jgi:hypothetical protein
MRIVAATILISVSLFAQAKRDLSVAPAPQRHALIVGNAAYPKWPLKNPLNDARTVAASLTRLGFSSQVATDLSLRNLEASINRFVAQVKSGDTALFYYAGHGIQLEGENYLVPVDFDAKDEADAKYVSYSASRLQERLEKAGARVIVLVLDACRNNPFQATRTVGGGLAAMGTGNGTFIAFATAPGKTADDNPRGNNGLFTSHLVQAIEEPGLTLDQVFNRVRERVHRDSQGRQVPWTVSSVIGDVYLGNAAAPANPLARPTSFTAQAPQEPVNPLARPRPQETAPPPPPTLDPSTELANGKAAMERGDYMTAAQKAQDILRNDAANKDALLLLTSAYFKQQQWDLFASTARQALAAGVSIPLGVGHHHTLTGAHAAALTVTKDSIAYQSLGGSCNQPAFSYPARQLVSAQVTTTMRGEIFLNFKILDDKNKTRNLNFVDPDSTLTKDSNGLPQVVSPPKASAHLGAIAAILSGLKQ